MNRTGVITRVSICVAMLIGAQFALGSLSGIEIVSVLLISFSFSFGVSISLSIATIFSFLRCIVFGSHLNVLVLYLIYYNLFSLYFAYLGKRFNRRFSFKSLFVVTFSSVIFTIFFTLLDDVITPLYFGFSRTAFFAYFYASLYTMLTHTICVGVSVAILFRPLTLVLSKIKVLK